MLEVGKLYRCADYCLILYPDYGSVVSPDLCGRKAWPAVGLNSEMAHLMCADLSQTIRKPVTFCKENSPVLILRQQAISYFEVLAVE